MKIRIPCTECPTRYVDEILLVEQTDDGLYLLKCPSGHKTTVRMQNHKFELLLDSGGMALLDGYSRESVASIAAALERFMEFYTRIVFLKHSIRKDSFDDAWGRVSNQSERQFGAFLFVYLLDTGKPPPIIDKLVMTTMKSSKNKTHQAFRNSVIHKGYIPSREQVIEYGEQVFKFIHDLLYELKASSEQHMQQVIMDAQINVHLQHPNNKIAALNIPTMISAITPPSGGPQSFEEGLKQIQDVRHRAYAV